MDVTIVTSAANDAEALDLLKLMDSRWQK